MKKAKIRDFLKHNLKHLKHNLKRNKVMVIWAIITVAFLGITQLLFRLPAPTKWLDAAWEADGFITFVGTITLGFVAIHQANQSHKLNTDMQKLEEARFASMISSGNFKTNYRSGKCSYPNNVDYKTAESIDLINYDNNSGDLKEKLIIYSEFYNNSDFPIVGLTSYIGKPDGWVQKMLGVKPVIDKSTYIAEKSSTKYQFIIPFKQVMTLTKAQGKDYIILSIEFENIFGYKTKARINMYINEEEITHEYRLAKFGDVKPRSNP